MVGAGGIGCELLKDLMLSGFGEIHIVDLDTITLSNLNRQFLFRQKDIDKSKSLTVTKAVQSFNYFGTQLVPHHGNIMNTSQFPIKWWDQFSYVFNALDNLEARRYVNKMCLFLKKPLMESGTTGFDGQVEPIYPYHSECFDCLTKVTPKTYPVCTIRSTPSQPVHCITWAKEFLFHQLFDESTEDAVSEKSLLKETNDAQEIANILKETNELNDLRNLMKSGSSSFIEELIVKIFQHDIERSLQLESLWKTRAKPVPLLYSEHRDNLQHLQQDKANEAILANDTKIWSVLENLYVLVKSSKALQARLTSGQESFVAFDKDDEDTLNFVASAANLRSSIFSIEIKSQFDVKQIAGNIIPAIATTNAIISGFSNLSALEFFKYDRPEFATVQQTSSTTFISIKPNKYVTSAILPGPNPQCASCGLASRGLLNLTQDQLELLSLKELVGKLVDKYHYAGDISVVLGSSRLIYDYDFEDNLEKKLAEINGFKNSELLLIQDEEDEFANLELYITIKDEAGSLLPDIELPAKKVVQEGGNDDDGELTEGEAELIVLDDDMGEIDDLEVLEESPRNNGEPSPKKRRVEV